MATLLSDRMRKLAEEVRAFEADLKRFLPPPSEASEPSLAIPPAPPNPALLNDLRAAVDGLRNLLWSYELAGPGAADPELLLQNARMQRVREMLQVLEQKPVLPSLPPTQVRSFFEEVQTIAQSALERHLAAAKGRALEDA